MVTVTTPIVVEAVAVDYRTMKLRDYVSATRWLINRLPADSQDAIQLQSELAKAERWSGQRRQDLARPFYETALQAVRQQSGFEPVVQFNAARPRKGRNSGR